LVVIQVADPSHAGEARREALRIAEHLELDEKRSGGAAIVVSEMATNILKHAKQGTILLQEVSKNGSRGFQSLALDKGPGIQDIAAALVDGQSSAGSLGIGLGAMRRLADTFDLYSIPGCGTAVLCEFWRGGKETHLKPRVQIGTISTPYPGEDSNGDGWIVKNSGDCLIFMVVDGLGHGILASEAAREAERIFLDSSSDSPATLLRDCHDGLLKTRGAAMGIATLDQNNGFLIFAGVGNIAGSIASPGSNRGLASHNGTLGHQTQRIQEFTYQWSPDSVLVMHSDGLGTRWNLNSYPGIWSKHPSLIAAALYRDFVRGQDDATVLVARNQN
jgi:anti-sigma regulatory factor (Ser/Thr protein kinase)